MFTGLKLWIAPYMGAIKMALLASVVLGLSTAVFLVKSRLDEVAALEDKVVALEQKTVELEHKVLFGEGKDAARDAADGQQRAATIIIRENDANVRAAAVSGVDGEAPESTRNTVRALQQARER